MQWWPPPSQLLIPGVFVYTKLLHPFCLFLVSGFCLPALSPVFNSKNTLSIMPQFSSPFLHLISVLLAFHQIFIWIATLPFILLHYLFRPSMFAVCCSTSIFIWFYSLQWDKVAEKCLWQSVVLMLLILPYIALCKLYVSSWMNIVA